MLRILNIATFTTFLLIGASADAREQDITVVGKPLTLAAWSEGITSKLERNLKYPSPMGMMRPASGIVSIRFHCSETGAPSDVVVYRKSGDRSLDIAAMRAVNRIKSLHPMPVSFAANQQYQANILFATSYGEYKDQLAMMRKEATRHDARFSNGDRTIALNIGFQPTGQ